MDAEVTTEAIHCPFPDIGLSQGDIYVLPFITGFSMVMFFLKSSVLASRLKLSS